MYCKNCGKQIDSDSKYCRHCGTNQFFSSDSSNKTKIQSDKIIEERSKDNVKNNTEVNNSQKLNNVSGNIEYDSTYKRNYTPTYVGFALLIISSIIHATITSNNSNSSAITSSDSNAGTILLFVALGSAIWCSIIAKELNRNQVFWGIFGFILPFLALIIIGFLRKRLYNNYYYNLSNADKSEFNNNLAYRIVKQGNNDESLILINRAIEQDPQNHAAYDTRAYIKYYWKDFEGALEDSNKSIELDSNAGIKFDHRGHINMKLGNKKEAIKDWEIAVEKGFEYSKIALNKYQ